MPPKKVNVLRAKGIYDPSTPYDISRSQVEAFMRCACCFFNDHAAGIKPPGMIPFNLNNRFDAACKAVFDLYRATKTPHPLAVANGLKAYPFGHPDDIEKWRDALHAGLSYHVPGTNMNLTGGLDDVWYDAENNQLILIDYKATSKVDKEGKPVAIDMSDEWKDGYKRQMCIYQEILAGMIRNNPEKFPAGCTVSHIAYFVYGNGYVDGDIFTEGMKFNITLEKFDRFDLSTDPRFASKDWVINAVKAAHACLNAANPPPLNEHCELCQNVMHRAISAGGNMDNVAMQRYDVRPNEERPGGMSILAASQSQQLIDDFNSSAAEAPLASSSSSAAASSSSSAARVSAQSSAEVIFSRGGGRKRPYAEAVRSILTPAEKKPRAPAAAKPRKPAARPAAKAPAKSRAKAGG